MNPAAARAGTTAANRNTGKGQSMESERQSLQLGAVVWGVTDVSRAVRFWTQALGYRLKGPAEPDRVVLVPQTGAGAQLSLNRVTSPHARRPHINLFTQDQEREVNRLLALGATLMAWKNAGESDYVVMKDPDDNPFCVVRAPA